LFSTTIFVQARAQGIAFKQLHHHVVNLVLDIEIEDLNDVMVAQAGDGARFALETRQELFFFHKVGAQDFDGYVAIELRMVGPVDLGHAAAPQRFRTRYFPML